MSKFRDHSSRENPYSNFQVANRDPNLDFQVANRDPNLDFQVANRDPMNKCAARVYRESPGTLSPLSEEHKDENEL